MKTINFYICVMVLLFTFTGYAQWAEGMGGAPPYYGSNPTPPGYVNPFTFTGTNQLTGVTITTPPNWGSINAQADAAAAATAAAIATNLPNQPSIPPPPYSGSNSQSPPPPKDWFLDNDGDGWHSQTTKASMSPGTGWKEGISKGLDCDDAKGLVWQLNSCGKCKLESNYKEWKVEDILKTDIPLLKEMIDKSKQVAPILKISKSLDLTNMGAFSNTYCQTTTLGGGIGILDANYTLAFELTHIINRSLQEENFNAIFNGISRSEYLIKASKIEAEGFIFSEIIKKEEAKNLNDCEKGKLNMNPLKQDYSGKTLAEIKTLIRQNGELDSAAKLLQTSAKSLDDGETLEANHGGFYDSWKQNILYYRKYYKETDQQIKARFPRCKK